MKWFITTIVFLLAGCEQSTTTSRGRQAVTPLNELVINASGDFNPETLTGYIKGRADSYSIIKSANGFVISNPPAGNAEIWVFATSKAGQPLAAATTVEVTPPKTMPANAALAATASIKGKIKTSSTNLATLQLVVTGSKTTATPGTDGAFEISGLPASTVSVSLTSNGTEVKNWTNLVTKSGETLVLDLLDLTESGSDDGDGGTTPKKLTGGSITLNNGKTKSGSLKVPVLLYLPTGATEIIFSESVVFGTNWLKATNVSEYTFSGAGQKTLYAKFRDTEGVMSDPVSATQDINTTAPSGGTIKLSTNIYRTSTTNINLLLAGTGAATMRLALSQSALSNRNFISFKNTYLLDDVGAMSEGDYTIYFQYRSDYGVESQVWTQAITVDQTGPAISGLTAVKSPSKEKIFEINVATGTETDISHYLVSCNGTTFQESTFDLAVKRASIDVTASALGCPSTDGSRTVSVQLKDSLGNKGNVATIPVVYDTAAPSTPTITQTSNSYTQLPTVTLSGNAENGSTVKITGGAAEATVVANGTYSIPVTLNFNQLNTLSVTAQDPASNVSLAATFSITHDTIAPIIDDGPHVKITAETLMFTATTSEAVTMTIDYGLNSSYGAEKENTSYKTDHAEIVTELSADTVYHYQITFTDRAGNSVQTSDDNRRTYIDKSAVLTGDEVWDRTSTPYYISGNFLIDTGQTVRIKRGVKLALEQDTQIWVRGRLIAEGTSDLPIHIFSNNPQPSPGDWDRIEFNNNDAAFTQPYVYTGGSRLNHVLIEHGGKRDTSVLIKQRSVSVTNSTIRKGKGFAIGVLDVKAEGTVSIRSNILEDNTGGGIETKLFDPDSQGQMVLIADNTIRNNGGPAIKSGEFQKIFADRNIFDSNSSSGHFESVIVEAKNNFFVKSQNGITLSPLKTGEPLTLTMEKNSFLDATAATGTVMHDSDAMTGLEVSYNVTFRHNTLQGNVVSNSGGALFHLNQPDTFDVANFNAYRVLAQANFTYNNFINNNLTGSYVFKTGSFRDYVEFDARNSYWNEINPLTVHQTYMYDYTDDNDLRLIYHSPVATKHVSTAPIAPPRSFQVTSFSAGTAALSWTLNKESDVGGYFIQYAATADDLIKGVGVTKIDAEDGSVSCTTTSTTKSCSVTGLGAGPYHFSVTAYDGGDKQEITLTTTDVDTGTDVISFTGHTYKDGQRVRLAPKVGGTLPAGITANTNYWITFVNANSFKLRSTFAAGPDIDITDAGSGEYKVIPNFPIKNANYTSQTFSINRTTNVLTAASHGLASGVRGKLSGVGNYLGLDTTTEYFVTKVDDNTLLLSTEKTGANVVDFDLTSGYPLMNSEINFDTNTFNVQSHLFANNTVVRFSGTDLPSAIDNFTDYYIVNRTPQSFQVSLTSGGAVHDIGDEDPDNTAFTVTPTNVGSGTLEFQPNYPDAARQDYMFLGNESWFATPVKVP